MRPVVEGLQAAILPKQPLAEQLAEMARRCRERLKVAPTIVECHPEQFELFAGCGFEVVPDRRIARGTYRLGAPS